MSICLVKQNDGTWVEKHQRFLFNVYKRFLKIVSRFLRFLTFFYFFSETFFYIYGLLHFFGEYPAVISRIVWEFVEGFLERISRLLGSGGGRKSVAICYCPWEKREFIGIDGR